MLLPQALLAYCIFAITRLQRTLSDLLTLLLAVDDNGGFELRFLNSMPPPGMSNAVRGEIPWTLIDLDTLLRLEMAAWS